MGCRILADPRPDGLRRWGLGAPEVGLAGGTDRERARAAEAGLIWGAGAGDDGMEQSLGGDLELPATMLSETRRARRG